MKATLIAIGIMKNETDKLIETIPGNTSGEKLQWLIETLDEAEIIDVEYLIKKGHSTPRENVTFIDDVNIPSIRQSVFELHLPKHKWKIRPKTGHTLNYVLGIDPIKDSSEDKTVEAYFSPPLGCPTTFMLSRRSLKHTLPNNKQEPNFVEVMKKNDLENLDNIFKSTFPDSKQ